MKNTSRSVVLGCALAGCLLLTACAVKPAPEIVEPEPYRREMLLILGNLHRSVGGFARLEFVVSFEDEQGSAWFRRHKNDVAMTLLETMSIERFDGLGTPEGREIFTTRMVMLANRELEPMRGRAELSKCNLR